MPTVTIACSADATVFETQPTKNYSTSAESPVRATSPEKILFEYYDIRGQIPDHATVLEAYTVRYQAKIAASGSRTISHNRLTGTWYESKVDYDHQPAGVSPLVNVAFNGVGAVNKALKTDVTAIVQAVVNGSAYTGLRIKSTSTSEVRFKSRSSNKPPVLVVTYTTAPSQPTICSPYDGATVLEARPTFSLDFHDVSGDDKTLQSLQFQFDDDIDFLTLSHDTGEITPVDAPQWEADFDLVLDEPTYWRGRVRDGDGNWSEWSEPRLVTRRTAPTLTLTNPGVPPADIVTEPTPPFSTELSPGYTQTFYQYRVIEIDDPLVVYWDTGKSPGDNSTVTPPDGALLLTPGSQYILEAGAWVAELGPVPGGGPHAIAIGVFSFTPDAGVDPVEDLTFTPDPAGKPEALIGWSDPSGVPDAIAFIRDNKVVKVIEDVIDLQVSPGVYALGDREFSTAVDHEWVVARIVNGVMSAANPTIIGSVTPTGVWLSTVDGSHWVRIKDMDKKKPVDWDAHEDTDLVTPLGAKNPFLVTGSIFGRRGQLDGWAKAHKGQTHEEMLEHLTAMLDVKKYPRGTPFILTMVDTRTKVMWWDTVRDERDEYVKRIRIRAELQELKD